MNIKELKELLDEINGVIVELGEKSEDGKLSLADLLGLSDNALKIYEESGDIDIIVEELKDLDGEEIKELANYAIKFVFGILKIVKNLK